MEHVFLLISSGMGILSDVLARDDVLVDAETICGHLRHWFRKAMCTIQLRFHRTKDVVGRL